MDLYNHPRFNDIKDAVSRRMDSEFNEVDLEAVEVAATREGDCLLGLIQRPSFEVLAKEWWSDLDMKRRKEIACEFLESRDEEPDPEELAEEAVGSGEYHYGEPVEDEEGVYLIKGDDLNLGKFPSEEAALEYLGELLLKEWKEEFDQEAEGYVENLTDDLIEQIEDDYYNDVVEHFEYREFYPMWSTLFEAKSEYASRKIMEYVDDLYDLNIGVIEPFGNYEAMLFIPGAGYDFYASHWIPMMDLFKWVEVKSFVAPGVKTDKCLYCGHTDFTVMKHVRHNAVSMGVQAGKKLLRVYEGIDDSVTIRCKFCDTEHFESNFDEVLTWRDYE